VSEREAIARLHRRAGFGLAPGELDELEALGVDTVIDRMVDPGGHDVPAGPADVWEGVEFPYTDSGRGAITAVTMWLDHLLTAARPFEEWMAWHWHGHLVSSMAVVAFVPKMTAQMNLFRTGGLGSFARLLRAITIDPGMLSYLDGVDSSGRHPNENYSRELLELFALGVGNFTEDDVLAGAGALTGWRVRFEETGSAVDPFRAVAYFDPAEHDDSPQEYLGRAGVHDLDTVIDAVVAHEACAPFVATRLGRAVLGPDADPGLLEDLARRFRDADLDLRVLARGVLEAVAEDRVTELVLGPMPWLLAAQRATGAELDADGRYYGLQGAGHLPLWPPNVGGWPGGATWLASSTTAQRYNLAGAVAAASPEDNEARRAAAAADLPALADALGRPEGFTAPTSAALSDLAADARRDGGIGLLTVALASPDLVIA
jgi:uncharacterized protein (DUF1800 family)